MTLIEAELQSAQTGGKDSALRDWVRALEATAPIAGNPQLILPCVIEELAEHAAKPLRCSRRASALTYRALADRANRYARWALEQRIGKGDVGVPAHAEPARVSGDLARHHQRRRRRLH